ncbi:MAG: acyltransferase [Caldilineaceae bacterium]
MAALLVVFYHITELSQTRFDSLFLGGVFAFGFTGVDFFFVLSGFIILYVHGRDLGDERVLGAYAAKRFVRLYPIYWCVALVKIGVIFVVPAYAKAHEADLAFLVKSLLLIPQENLPIIGAAWTLSYEVLFYALFGVAILVGPRWAYRFALTWLALIALVFMLNRAGLIASQAYSAVNFPGSSIFCGWLRDLHKKSR